VSDGKYSDFLAGVKGPENFVYLDPPYHPVSATAGFVDYNENGFNVSNQEELHDLIVDLTRDDVLVLLSNSNTELIRSLYSEKIFTQIEIPVRRAIAAKSSSRGITSELLISNFGRPN
jgi:DNA adenine methylase